jgi:hypothetical protein
MIDGISIVIIFLFVVNVVFALGYVLMGKNALTFLKLKLYRQKGAWFISRYDSTRVLINYSKYVRKYLWGKKEGESEQFETKIKETLNQEQDTGEPVIFLREGFGTNIDPFEQFKPSEGERSIQTNYRLAFNEGLATARKEMEKKDNTQTILMIMLGAIALLSLGALAFSYLNNDMLTQFIAQIQSYKPAVDEALRGGLIVS